eukprot:scaffold1188_cov255-Pinguiococcus_pyrenoidosus.AAC.17
MRGRRTLRLEKIEGSPGTSGGFAAGSWRLYLQCEALLWIEKATFKKVVWTAELLQENLEVMGSSGSRAKQNASGWG